MKQNLNALNDYLFGALEALTNDELKGEDLEREIKRNTAIQKVAQTIIEGGELALKAKRFSAEYGALEDLTIPLIDGGENDY
jgi:hypothetical protein